SVLVMVFEPSAWVSVCTVVSTVVPSDFGWRFTQRRLPSYSPQSWPSMSTEVSERQRIVPSGTVSYTQGWELCSVFGSGNDSDGSGCTGPDVDAGHAAPEYSAVPPQT